MGSPPEKKNPLTVSPVTFPKTLLPILETRLPHSCCIYNQVLSYKDLNLEFFTLGKEGSDNAWVISRLTRHDGGDNVAISAPTSISHEDIADIKDCLLSSDVIRWNGQTLLSNLQKHVSSIIYDISVNLKGNPVEVHPCRSFYMDKDEAAALDVTYLSSDITVSRLNPERDSEFITSTWKYAHECNVPKCISSNASVGIFTGDICISGAITTEFGLVAALYTLKEYRKKGYAQLALKYIFKELAKDGRIPCLHAELRNERPLALYKNLGFKSIGVYDWIFFIKLDID